MARIAERGMVLVVSLIILLAMTVIGLAGMEITSLEEKMTGSMRDRNVAFQAAESALNEAENFLENTRPLPDFTDKDGLLSETGNWQTVNWENNLAVALYEGPGFDNLALPSAYVIEKLDYISHGVELGDAVTTDEYFRITARSQGLSGSAQVILQTVYKR
ncbi:pilus assembly PilX family protein [Amphritea balenae]|uniref:Pilus assembly protein PilX n=1 Tax=Amphritea balenae TaxID=452629 RepID=A0A3P1SQ67_9GAMM|nr:PilX N-terminal domain-containing pilus assembly protein [Amphritea balenae]RRC98785.1 hypothetical protein EHS89_11375 [Amphritea balenae]GGK61656.1 hypothetical protein GCM10007941_09740 [Amphritea balenae]